MITTRGGEQHTHQAHLLRRVGTTSTFMFSTLRPRLWSCSGTDCGHGHVLEDRSTRFLRGVIRLEEILADGTVVVLHAPRQGVHLFSWQT